ncbi:hypothetical protein CPB84DRAFT_1853205 [Gymnopilus junonius]|uniref:Uncharacterized protein n=1 Tax=Gymnopilus junonius TaxID=109634 RepID=A0A9P5NBX6_GYMJU|nr:hypothetical protein CPB84DRAFT_1853205 [Gymnopilus junonius]
MISRLSPLPLGALDDTNSSVIYGTQSFFRTPETQSSFHIAWYFLFDYAPFIDSDLFCRPAGLVLKCLKNKHWLRAREPWSLSYSTKDGTIVSSFPLSSLTTSAFYDLCREQDVGRGLQELNQIAPAALPLAAYKHSQITNSRDTTASLLLKIASVPIPFSKGSNGDIHFDSLEATPFKPIDPQSSKSHIRDRNAQIDNLTDEMDEDKVDEDDVDDDKVDEDDGDEDEDDVDQDQDDDKDEDDLKAGEYETSKEESDWDEGDWDKNDEDKDEDEDEDKDKDDHKPDGEETDREETDEEETDEEETDEEETDEEEDLSDFKPPSYGRSRTRIVLPRQGRYSPGGTAIVKVHTSTTASDESL